MGKSTENKILLIVTLLGLHFAILAQSPQKFVYQLVVRDASNNLVTNLQVGIKATIIQGSSNGTPVYSERHLTTTNANGLANLEIGTGTVLSGIFSNINWANGPYFIKTETDPNGGTNYSVSSVNQILSVPYTLYANSVGNSGNAVPAGNGESGAVLTICGGKPTWTIGGQCPGRITSLQCAGATNNGTLISGVAASSVSSVIAYTGGNGATHNGQTVTSTGVTGLTATLAAGTFASGAGSLTYTITGTPASNGTASFAISIGGQSCTLTRTVALPVGSLASLDCAGATNNGTLTSGVAASSVSSVIAYTGGNGGTHNGQTVSSTGVTGLTATLAAGTFASGAGTLTYTITGTPASSGTASFAISIGGQSCTLTRTVALPVGTISTINCAGATNNGTLTSGVAASSVSSVIAYTGGNGGTHNGQTVSSTGVTGLTATLAAGTFASGAGSLTYTITGTPASSGTASFAISIGGQSCTLTRTVALPVGTISTINCAGATNNGTLTLGVAASSVSSVIAYTGGNGGTHNGQTVTSTGVTGLTATLAAGTFANGAGTLTYTITGTPASSGTASFAISIGGQSCALNLSVGQSSSGYAAGTVNCAAGAAAIVDVINATTGKVWMDRNLGAAQAAANISDANAYGDLYQWGRRADGHQCRNSAITSVLSTSDQPSTSSFIASSGDWRNPKNDNLWQGQNGINNPCPSGYRLPTSAEFDAERASWSSANSNGAFASPLKLLRASYRNAADGVLSSSASGNYWTSTISSNLATRMQFSSSVASNSNINRAYGFSVRCIKEAAILQGAINSINCAGATNNGTLTSGVAASSVSSVIAYTGGNGGTHNGQTVSSTGVTGLTATLAAGTFASGAGSLTYTITGTPASNGTASFAISIGGQSCTLTRTVALPVGSLASLDCAGATNNGTLTSGVAASSVSSVIAYTGGNGGTHNGQTVTSTGVTGLTATLAAGTFASGAGSLTYTITGTPASSGTASFAISIGGQSCTLTRTVALPVGSLASLDCAGATHSGTLNAGVPASSVSFTVNYTGGNGGTYNAQTINSTNVTGLTATLDAGTLNNGAGTLTYTITGTPASSGMVYFDINIGGQNCSVHRMVGFGAAYPLSAVFCSGVPTAVVDITSPGTGRVWMDRNLGASRAATSTTDAAAYGDLYQWGRGADGHQCRNSLTTNTLSSSGTPGNNRFIINDFDWYNGGINGSCGIGNQSWYNCDFWQGVSGVNNPCPAGYRIPTIQEFENERRSITEYTSSYNGATTNIADFSSPLKLTLAGVRSHNNGTIISSDTWGEYWCSNGASAWSGPGVGVFELTPYFNGFGDILETNTYQGRGSSVRCIKELPAVNGTITNLNCAGVSHTGNIVAGAATVGATTQIPYTGGNGGSFNNITSISYGVWGLSATATASNFSNGSGVINFSISGTPSLVGEAIFHVEIDGQACTFTRPVTSAFSAGTVHCGSTTSIVEMTSARTGRVWMDRNLGASQVASSVNDAASFGDLYQWGRGADGHQCRNSNNTLTQSSTDQPGHGDFISIGPYVVGGPALPVDWRSPKNDNLWQGAAGINNPCPSGYRIPTRAEFEYEFPCCPPDLFNRLKMPHAGLRIFNEGVVYVPQNNGGRYWTSNTDNGTAYSEYFLYDANIYNQIITSGRRGDGLSVRCIREEASRSGYMETLDCGSANIIGNIRLDQGTPVTVEIPYTGGNGGEFWPQYAILPLETGLPAVLLNVNGNLVADGLGGGQLNVGNGILYFGIGGSAQSIDVNQSTYPSYCTFNINALGHSCAIQIPVIPTFQSGTVHCPNQCVTPVEDVLNPITGKTWMSLNLGACQTGTWTNDVNAFGDLYQWGRFADGHQCRNSVITSNTSNTSFPGNAFIPGIFDVSNNYDWRDPQEDGLWQDPLASISNNPCPIGYRLPSSSELEDEMNSWISPDEAGAFYSPLKLSTAYYRDLNGDIQSSISSVTGNYVPAFYWSSTVSGTNALGLFFSDDGANQPATIQAQPRSIGGSVRCIRQ